MTICELALMCSPDDPVVMIDTKNYNLHQPPLQVERVFGFINSQAKSIFSASSLKLQV